MIIFGLFWIGGSVEFSTILCRFAIFRVFAPSVLLPAACLLYHFMQLLESKRLGAKTGEATFLKQPCPILLIGGGRQDENAEFRTEVRSELFEFVQELEPIHRRHMKVAEYNIGRGGGLFGSTGLRKIN